MLHSPKVDFSPVRNDGKNKNRTRCAPHGDDYNKNFQFDKFQRLLSVIYKKLINYKGDFKMRNQTNNVFKVKRQKSKLFLIILCIFGLLFSYSCSCKNRVSNPDDTPTDGGVTPPPGTFSISEATNNVTTNFVVKKASTVGEIKIGFVSANNYPYTLSYEVVDNEGADDNSKILKSDTDYANDVLTIKDTGLAKIRAIPSVDAPAVRTITINFTFKANDTNLNNNTQTLSVEVKLTHFKEITIENEFKKTINEIGNWLTTSLGLLEFETATANGNTITVNVRGIDNEDSSNYDTKNVSKSDFGSNRLLNKLKVEMSNRNVPYYKDLTYIKNEKSGDNEAFYYNLVVNDAYELANTEVVIVVNNLKHTTGGGFAINWLD